MQPRRLHLLHRPFSHGGRCGGFCLELLAMPTITRCCDGQRFVQAEIVYVRPTCRSATENEFETLNWAESRNTPKYAVFGLPDPGRRISKLFSSYKPA